VKLTFLAAALGCYLAALCVAQVPPQSASSVPLKTLDDVIAHVELTVGLKGLGGLPLRTP
jgi:hypothetical protein